MSGQDSRSSKARPRDISRVSESLPSHSACYQQANAVASEPATSRLTASRAPQRRSASLRVPQVRHSLPHLHHLRLELGVGVLPQRDELQVMTQRLLSLPLRLVQLAQTLLHAREYLGIE